MYLPHTITSYLGKRDVSYETVSHRRSSTSSQSASRAHVPRQKVAKAVLFCDEDDYLLAIVPASRRVDASALSELLGQRELMLASEDELAMIFADCELGAVPPLGAAYGVTSVVDEALLRQPDVYLEAGDHLHLFHLAGEDFRKLMKGVSSAAIAC